MARGRPNSMSASIAARAVRPRWITSSTSTTTLPSTSGTFEARCPAGSRTWWSARGCVDLGRDLVHAGQRVQDDRLTPHQRQGLGVDAIDTLDLVVCGLIGEPLLLDPRLVHDVDLRQYGGQVASLRPRHVVLVEV